MYIYIYYIQIVMHGTTGVTIYYHTYVIIYNIPNAWIYYSHFYTGYAWYRNKIYLASSKGVVASLTRDFKRINRGFYCCNCVETTIWKQVSLLPPYTKEYKGMYICITFNRLFYYEFKYTIIILNLYQIMYIIFVYTL